MDRRVLAPNAHKHDTDELESFQACSGMQASRDVRLAMLMKSASMSRDKPSMTRTGSSRDKPSMTRTGSGVSVQLRSSSRPQSTGSLRRQGGSIRRQGGGSSPTRMPQTFPHAEDDDSQLIAKIVSGMASLPKARQDPAASKSTRPGHAVFGAGADFESAEAFVASAPDDVTILKEGLLHKRVVSKEIFWKQRAMTLTDENIYIRNEEGGDIRDTIDLLNITHVRRMVRESFTEALQSRQQVDDGSPTTPTRSACTSSQKPSNQDSLSRSQSGSGPEGVAPRRFFKASKKLMAVSRVFGTSRKDSKGQDAVASASGDLKIEGVHAAEWHNVFELYVECFGRTLYFRARNADECNEWVKGIQDAMEAAHIAYEQSLHMTIRERTQLWARATYDNQWLQTLVCLLLITNFVIALVQCELGLNFAADDDVNKKALATYLDVVDIVFNFIYLAELLLNMYGNWFWGFFGSSWGCFDFIIVCMSLVDTGYVLSGADGKGLAVVRLLRVFRIVRLFHRLEDMKRILSANMAAMGPVSNAFLFLLVIVSIYAVMAVNLFAVSTESDPDCNQDRGCFRSFSYSFFTLLGIATGESWTPFVYSMRTDEGYIDTIVGIFFASYTGLVVIVALNIIVAVLLENFVSSISKYDAQARISMEAIAHHQNAGPLDPLMATLANFKSPQHFKSQLDLLFCLWDVDDNGTVDFDEVKSGIQKLGYEPAIKLSSDDWDDINMHGLLLDANGEMNNQSFELAMRFQLADYSQRLLSNKMMQSVKGGNEFAPVLFSIKMAILEIMAAATERRQSALDQQKELESFKRQFVRPRESQRSLEEGAFERSAMNDRSVDVSEVQGTGETGIVEFKSMMNILTSNQNDMSSRLVEVARAQMEMKTQISELAASLSTSLGSVTGLNTTLTDSRGAHCEGEGGKEVTKDPDLRSVHRNSILSTMQCACKSGKLFLECHGSGIG